MNSQPTPERLKCECKHYWVDHKDDAQLACAECRWEAWQPNPQTPPVNSREETTPPLADTVGGEECECLCHREPLGCSRCVKGCKNWQPTPPSKQSRVRPSKEVDKLVDELTEKQLRGLYEGLSTPPSKQSGENVLQIGGTTMIFNGGNPLEGCPKDWEEAKAIETSLNTGKDEDEPQPRWGFDCGFKLDYDGPIVSINSRFYPPKTHYGPTWDGTVTVCVMGEEVEDRKFDCKTLNELREQVERYVDEIKARAVGLFKIDSTPPKAEGERNEEWRERFRKRFRYVSKPEHFVWMWIDTEGEPGDVGTPERVESFIQDLLTSATRAAEERKDGEWKKRIESALSRLHKSHEALLQKSPTTLTKQERPVVEWSMETFDKFIRTILLPPPPDKPTTNG